MARRRALPAGAGPAGSASILPADLTFRRPGDGRTPTRWRAEQRAWMLAHGIDPYDLAAVARVQRESRRAHAVVVRELDALTRARRRAEGAGPDDPA